MGSQWRCLSGEAKAVRSGQGTRHRSGYMSRGNPGGGTCEGQRTILKAQPEHKPSQGIRWSGGEVCTSGGKTWPCMAPPPIPQTEQKQKLKGVTHFPAECKKHGWRILTNTQVTISPLVRNDQAFKEGGKCNLLTRSRTD